MVKAAARRSIEPAKPAKAPSPSTDVATGAPAKSARGKAAAPIFVETDGTIAPKRSPRSRSQVSDGIKADGALAPKKARASAKSDGVHAIDEAGTVAAGASTGASPPVEGGRPTKASPAARVKRTSRASARTRVAATIADVVEPNPTEAPSSAKQVSRRDGAKRADVKAVAGKALPSAKASSSKPKGDGATAAEVTAGSPVKPAGVKVAARSTVKSAAARRSAAKAPAPAGGCAPIKLGFLSDFVGFHLRLAQDASYRAFARFKDKDLVKPGRFPALAIIHLNPGISQSALGRAIARDKSTVSPLIKDLQKNGLINRKPSPNDRRSVTLVLTKKGERVLERLHVRAREHESDLDRLVGTSKSKLVGLLDKITAALTT